MKTETLYEDGTVRLDAEGVTIRHFYFPFVSKHVPYETITAVSTGVLPGLGGRWRIWGTTDFSSWYSFDLLRPKKTTAVELEISTWGTPAFTPRDPDEVERIIARHLTSR